MSDDADAPGYSSGEQRILESAAAGEVAPESVESIMDAMATLSMAAKKPLELAAQNANLRAQVKGAYAVAHALVKRAGGDVVLTGAEVNAIPPGETMRVEHRPDGGVRLVVGTAGHRKGKR